MKSIFLITLLLFTSCISYPRQVVSIPLSGKTSFKILAAENWKPFSALQKITVEWGAHKLTFNTQLEVTENTIHIVGLTPVHSRSFLISYSDGILDFKEHPFFKYPVNPENMLADFQMAFANASKISIEGGVVKNEVLKREFWDDDQKLISVTYSDSNIWQAEVKIENSLHNYKLIITTLQFEYL